MFAWDETATLPTIGVPTLIVTSDHDKLTLPEASQHMAATIPGSRLAMISGAGHPGFLERSEAYDEAFADFARNITTSANSSGV